MIFSVWGFKNGLLTGEIKVFFNVVISLVDLYFIGYSYIIFSVIFCTTDDFFENTLMLTLRT